MTKTLSTQVLIPLVLTTLIPGLLFILLAGWLTERVLVDYFRQQAIKVTHHINEELYSRYFNRGYELQGELFNPLDAKSMEELDALLAHHKESFHLERINFFDRTGKVMYSTDRRLLGLSGSHLPQIQEALKGRTTSRVVYQYGQDLVSLAAHPKIESDVIEVYVPLICLSPQLPTYRQQIGVLEVYQNIDVIRQWIRRIRNYMGGVMGTLLVLAMASAFFALRRKAIKPLHRMMTGIEASAAVTDGRLKVNPIDGGDSRELKGLANSFNRLAQDVVEKSCRLESLGYQHRTIVEASQECVVLCDAQGRCLSINPYGARVLELDSPEEVIGLSYPDLWENPYQSKARQVLRKGLHGGSVTFEVEGPTRKTRTKKWWSVMLSPVCNDQGEVAHFIGVSRDITEQKLLQDQFMRAQKMEATGRLAEGVAHDFNNLLSVIISYSELMSRRLEPDSPFHRDLEQILRAGHRAADLTRQLLVFSRKQVMEPQVLDLNAVLTDLSRMLRRVIGEDIDLAVVAGADLGSIRADPGQVEQIIMNLVVNARDAMPDGGRLTLETANVEVTEDYVRMHGEAVPGPYVQVSVSDTGCGMTDEVMVHLFEPFFTTKGEGKGTGLGLSTVYGIVKQHGGHIGVYSEPGKGTCFKVYFPQVGETADPVREKTPEEMPRGRETILLVEDEDAVRTVVDRTLTELGYRVFACGSAEEALDLLGDHTVPPDMLLTDVVLPGMNGRELADRVRSIRPGIKVLYVSGYTGDAIAHLGILDPGGAFLQKPFRLPMVARKVRELLDGESVGSR